MKESDYLLGYFFVYACINYNKITLMLKKLALLVINVSIFRTQFVTYFPFEKNNIIHYFFNLNTTILQDF